MMSRGWFGESSRHSLSAKGIKTYMSRKRPLYMVKHQNTFIDTGKVWEPIDGRGSHWVSKRRAPEVEKELSGGREHSHWMDKKEELKKLDWETPHEKETAGEFTHRSIDARENPGIGKWWESVKFGMFHPWQDYDDEYIRYLDSSGQDQVLHDGDGFWSDGHMERAAERGAAVVGRVVTSANMEPLLDHGKGGSARDIALDIFFGRDDPERKTHPVIAYHKMKGEGMVSEGQRRYLIIKKLRGEEKWRLYSKKVDEKTGKRRNLGTFDSPEEARNRERQVEFFKKQGKKGGRRYNSGLIDLAVGGLIVYGGVKAYQHYEKKHRRKVKKK
jgi:hypothetical protein